jgi:glutaredoxin
MHPAPRPVDAILLLLRCASLAALMAALPGHAQYKVIGTDGKVTYTDRTPAAGEGRVTSLGNRAGGGLADVTLPAELRTASNRYPVTLYSNSGTCDLCESARQLLRQRGVPYNEKLIASAEDGEALERISGGRGLPALTIGTQVLRGLSSELWNTYLDGAGYPRESRLPKGYQFPAATPLTERREAAVAAAPAASRPAAPQRAAAPEPAPDPSTIKF